MGKVLLQALLWVLALMIPMGLAQGATGILQISISGLPANTDARVTLSSSLLERPIAVTRSSRLSNLLPGTYTLSAEGVEVNGVVFQGVPLRQEVELKSSAETSASVVYSAPNSNLRLQVEGLLSGNNARLTLSGPNDYSRELSLNGNATVRNLIPGVYTVAASDVMVGGDPYEPTPAIQSVRVLPNETPVAKVSYSMSLGRLVLIPQGIPSGLAAQVTLSGPNTPTTNLSLTAERSLDLPKGTYTLNLPLLYFGGRAYGPVQASQSVDVTPRRESRVPIAYQALPNVDLTLIPRNLPVGKSVDVVLTGPNNTRIELNITGSETVLDLVVGEYTLSSLPNSPVKIAQQRLQVRPGMAAVEFEVRITATGASDIATLRGHSSRVLSVAFSPDGRTLASGSYDDTIKLWDVATAKEIATLRGHSNAVNSVAFSPDGKTLASGSWDNTIKLWDVATRKEMVTLRGHSDYVRSVAFSPDGKTLASGSWDDTIKLWDVATRKEIATLRGRSENVESVAFSPDGKTLASQNWDDTIKLWDVATAKEIATLRGHSNWVLCVAFSPDGKTLASGNDDTIKLWDVATRKEIATLEGHIYNVESVAFSPDGKTLASGSNDDTIKLWDVATAREITTLRGHSTGVTSVAFSPDGRTLASGSADYTIKLWQIRFD